VENKVELKLPKQVLKILDRLDDYGYSGYIHGECVRLLICGQTQIDFNVMTNAEMPRIRAIFDDEAFHVNDTNHKFDDIIVTVLGVAVSVTSYNDIEFELKKRYAFTFNAIAYSAKKGLCDPLDGMSALEKGEIRRLVMTTPDKNEMFTKQDFETILMCRNIKEILNEYSEIFVLMIPEFKMIADCEVLGHLFELTMKSIGCSTPVLTLRYALLFHELGKSDCHSKSWDGVEYYHGYTERSRIYAQRIMSRAGCSIDEIKQVEYIIKKHEKLLQISEGDMLDLKYEYPADLLKLLLLFNYARLRALGDDKSAAKFKKLSKMV
jgi:tRNA nucleotidyltransferase (CCA-adding enzyme)